MSLRYEKAPEIDLYHVFLDDERIATLVRNKDHYLLLPSVNHHLFNLEEVTFIQTTITQLNRKVSK